MGIYDTKTIGQRIDGNPYVGRGIVIGTTQDGKNAVSAYFIMGRSANSRNRVFVKEEETLYTKPFDESLVEDPTLIIYAAQRRVDNRLIVTNGDQTDTVAKGLEDGKTFSQALQSRSFEPDAPNFTPRISGMLTFSENSFSYEMSILKSIDAVGSECARYTFSYPSVPGLGHFIHTYVTDGNPIPTFQGEPERIAIPDEIDVFTADLWEHLDADNRISLYVRYTDLCVGAYRDRLINKNDEGEGEIG